MTQNQLQFIGNFCQAFVEASTKGETVAVDLDGLINKLSENKPGWVYAEERQQSKYHCAECKCTYDILGDYGVCPSCARPNFRKVIDAKLDALEAQFKVADETLADRHEREVEWEKLTRCVSEFEALANTLRRHLLQLPATPSRKADLGKLSFQRILAAAQRLEEWYGIDLLRGIPEDDRQFLNLMFNRRHVFTHNAGRVDREYIDNTGDNSVRVNQVIRLRSREIKRLLSLVRACSMALVEGVESIK